VVVGTSERAAEIDDYVTIRYDAAGNPLWASRFDGPCSSNVAEAVEVDAAGNAYVTGTSYDCEGGSQFATVRYDPQGVPVWAARSDLPGDTSADTAGNLALDSAGAVYVTGWSQPSPVEFHSTTLRYAPDGTLAWMVRHAGSEQIDAWTHFIDVDDRGTVHVSGQAAVTGAGGQTEYDLLTVAYSQGTAIAHCEATPNSTGGEASLWALGSPSIAANEFTLVAAPVPDESTLFFYGPERTQLPFGDGFLCVRGGLTRLYPPQLGVDHVASREVDLAALGILPSTLHFQCWFRDPTSSGFPFNTSNAIAVRFVP
jgi:hypothetical protein